MTKKRFRACLLLGVLCVVCACWYLLRTSASSSKHYYSRWAFVSMRMSVSVKLEEKLEEVQASLSPLQVCIHLLVLRGGCCCQCNWHQPITYYREFGSSSHDCHSVSLCPNVRRQAELAAAQAAKEEIEGNVWERDVRQISLTLCWKGCCGVARGDYHSFFLLRRVCAA